MIAKLNCINSQFFNNLEISTNELVTDDKVHPAIMQQYRGNKWVQLYGPAMYQECQKLDINFSKTKQNIKTNLIKDFSNEYNYYDYSDFGLKNEENDDLDELSKYLRASLALNSEFIKNPYKYWDVIGCNDFPRLSRFSNKSLILKAHECDVESLFSLNKYLVGQDKGNLGLGKGTAMLRINSYQKSGVNLSRYDPYQERKEDL